MMTRKERIARFFEDQYYTMLIHLRSVLEWLHILHPPTKADMQRDIEIMARQFDETIQEN